MSFYRIWKNCGWRVAFQHSCRLVTEFKSLIVIVEDLTWVATRVEDQLKSRRPSLIFLKNLYRWSKLISRVVEGETTTESFKLKEFHFDEVWKYNIPSRFPPTSSPFSVMSSSSKIFESQCRDLLEMKSKNSWESFHVNSMRSCTSMSQNVLIYLTCLNTSMKDYDCRKLDLSKCICSGVIGSWIFSKILTFLPLKIYCYRQVQSSGL